MLDMRVLVVGAMALMIAITGSSNDSGSGKQPLAATRAETAMVQLLLTARCPPANPTVADCQSDVTGSIGHKRD
ncbi:MAG: hypothetical protein P4L98_08995 [Ancalomicrobiaceae bacterium]|nr:hypothetical protein [Ancalomicrobiaceae bacterium]